MVYEEDAWQLELEDHGIDKNPSSCARTAPRSMRPRTRPTTREVRRVRPRGDGAGRGPQLPGEAGSTRPSSYWATRPTSSGQVFLLVRQPFPREDELRRGTGVDLDDLLDEAIDRACGAVEDRLDDRIRDDDLDDEDIERIAHQVGIGAVRYDIVSKQPTKAITFEWDRAGLRGQSAPVRPVRSTRAVVVSSRKRESIETGMADVETAVDADLLETEAERDLRETIARFPAVVDEAAGRPGAPPDRDLHSRVRRPV